MKPALLLAVSLLTHASLFAQGYVYFNNCFNSFAPIYGVNPNDPMTAHTGNALTNGGPVDYTGYPLLLGTGYTAALWAAPGGVIDIAQFQQLATVPFGTNTIRAGCFNYVSGVDVPWTTYGGEPVNYMIRAWDNRGGTVNGWAQVLADPTIAAGSSVIFPGTVAFPLSTPAPLRGVTSFNLTVVPEPGVLALGLLGGGLLALVLC